MKTIFLTASVLSVVSTFALAQQPAASPPPAERETPMMRAPAAPEPATPNPAAPVAGENSFTETQAKERIAEAGYTNVGPLKLDTNGVWRGMATKGGQTVNVGLDYQGNVVQQ